MSNGIAMLTALTSPQGQDLPDSQQVAIAVQFNPESLDLTYTNSVQKGQRKQPPQVITETKAQLSFELIFDTTHSGVDVRKITLDIAQLMDPKDPRKATRRDNSIGIPAKVLFEWGTFKFEGYIDNIKEKLDFFSSDGVPLRSSLTVSMTNAQKNLLPSSQGKKDAVDTQGNLGLDAPTDAYQSGMGKDLSLADKARQLGDENAARSLAEMNGIENLRLPEVDNLMVMNQKAFSAHTNVNTTANASFNTSLKTSGSLSSMGGTNSDFSVNTQGSTESLFGGLKVGTTQKISAPKVDLTTSVSAGITGGISAGVSLSGGAGIELGVGIDAGLGGSASVGGAMGISAGLTADVGLDADFEAGIKFDD
ncbi:hypothetical protein [Aliikangiella maris]|uniref:Contractile injection system tube protein N-terminal domain-containing protein n=2 Tax=Aliikangiella maris TaxID=3162458 RepID=A0ABV3MJQ8_9GAMM